MASFDGSSPADVRAAKWEAALARDLGLAPNTVRHHIRSIYSKLGVNGKAGIAQLLHHPPG